jgi:hypothetical protein
MTLGIQTVVVDDKEDIRTSTRKVLEGSVRA